MKKTRALCVIVIVIVIVMIMLAFITGCGSTWMSNTEPPPDDGDKTGVHNTETAKPIQPRQNRHSLKPRLMLCMK